MITQPGSITPMSSETRSMEHKLRRMIFNSIASYPGISFGRLMRLLELNRSTLRYHLRYLKRARKIDSRLENGRRCYFCLDETNTVRSAVDQDPDTLTKTQKRMLRLIRDNPGITRKELARKTRISKSTVGYNIKKLAERNLLWEVPRGRETGYEYKSQEKLLDELSRLLIEKYVNNEIDKETFLKLKGELDRKKMGF